MKSLDAIEFLMTPLDVISCTKCGLLEPSVIFKRIKYGDRRCVECYRKYDQSIKQKKRLLNPEPGRLAARKYHNYHKVERKEYRLRNINRYIEYYRRSHLKSYIDKKNHIHQLKSVPCLDCKESFPPFVLDFDHRDQDSKVMAIHKMVSHASWEAVLKEIEKCDIVCANCHRLRTKHQNVYTFNATRTKNREFLDSIKTSPCIDCLKRLDPCQMDFDHIDNKYMNIACMVNYSREKLVTEISKCELVCANCHRIRTNNRQES